MLKDQRSLTSLTTVRRNVAKGETEFIARVDVPLPFVVLFMIGNPVMYIIRLANVDQLFGGKGLILSIVGTFVDAVDA